MSLEWEDLDELPREGISIREYLNILSDFLNSGVKVRRVFSKDVNPASIYQNLLILAEENKGFTVHMRNNKVYLVKKNDQ